MLLYKLSHKHLTKLSKINIQVRSSNDIKDILRRVRANSASINPLLHNVFTVTLEKLPINTSHIGAGKTYHAEGAEEVDTTPVKLTIVTLASLKNQRYEIPK